MLHSRFLSNATSNFTTSNPAESSQASLANENIIFLFIISCTFMNTYFLSTLTVKSSPLKLIFRANVGI